ncbi:MAG: NAD(P)-dependent oxidoreductase [Betaproteobacteria bacterium]
MRLLVFGATGATGKEVLRLASAEGWNAHAFVRANADRQVAEFAERMHRGDVTDPAATTPALAGVDAVAVCLGISRRSRSPFAPLVSPADLTSRATAAIVAGMRAQRVRRIVYVSAFGAGESWGEIPWWGRAFIAASRVRFSIADHTRSEALLAASGLDWTALRPMMLDDRPATQPAREMRPGDSLLNKVPRAALARTILRALADRGSYGRALPLSADRPRAATHRA